MKTKTPFSQENLNEIFKISPTDSGRVISRESSSLEFKESFGWAGLSKYLKTCAAFANAKGGYIIYGIANNPHLLCGLEKKSQRLFEEIDPAKLSQSFNEHFSPEIEWTIQEYELQGKIFGLLYIHEAKDKPVVCTKDFGKDLKEGDIYYRYRGRSERIKYPELKAILENKREAEQNLWMQHIRNIARIGVREVGIFDLHTGSVTGSGGSFLIDESLLSQLSFIKEGEFSEIKGKPTLKLIGHVKTLARNILGTTQKHIIKTKGIRTSDIILGALNQENVPEPDDYIKQICFESTAFLPIYYYIKKSGKNLTEVIVMLEGVVSRSNSRRKLIERVKNGKTQAHPIPNGATLAAIKKREYAEVLCKGKINPGLEGKDLEYCLQSIRGLTEEEVKSNSQYLRDLLCFWLSKHYASAEGSVADNLRRAICWVDEALHMGDCK